MKYVLVQYDSEEVKEIQPFTGTGNMIEHKACPPQQEPNNGRRGRFYCRVNKQTYLETVNKLLAHIQRGDIYEINYCIEFFAEDIVIDPLKVFKKLKELTEAPFAGLYQCGDEIIICASPERFLKKEGNKLISQPMKGTAPRDKDADEDERQKKALAHSLKEQTENVMALDVARNDISIIAKKGTVQATELFGVRTFKNVHQMVSTVACELKDGVELKEILKATFPPASMTGAPKISACKLIKKYEASPRGIYSGCIGSINDNGDFDLSVVIRTLIYNPKLKRLSFHVGSAITASASPEKEWAECLLKAEALLKSLGTTAADVQFL